MTTRRRRQTRTRRTTGFPPELHNAAIATADREHTMISEAIHVAIASGTPAFLFRRLGVYRTRRTRRRIHLATARLDWVRDTFVRTVVAEATRILTTLSAFYAPMDEATAREIEREQQWQRHARIADCLRCETADSMTAYHDASPRCESGGYPHCTCDICY